MGEDAAPGKPWFQSGKRGLLAPFAVGTIDQALMAEDGMRGGIVCWVRWRRKSSQECVERFSDVFRFLSAFFERLCYRKWLMLYFLEIPKE